eukprot:2751661-Prymnesium_polylepis.2
MDALEMPTAGHRGAQQYERCGVKGGVQQSLIFTRAPTHLIVRLGRHGRRGHLSWDVANRANH